MALRALKTDEEIAAIPFDQEILIELPGGEDEPKTTTDPGAKSLQEQYEALQKLQKADNERADKAERDAQDARRVAADRERELHEQRTRATSLEGDIISGGLAAAQAEAAAAKVALKNAFEAGDAAAMGDAQERIGRSAAKILALESGAAEIAERKEVKPVIQEQRQIDPVTAIDSNPQLLSAEKDWLKTHLDAYGPRNNELGVGYERAIKKGLVRGTPDYFAFLEDFMGYKTEETGVQAPVSRTERGGDGRPTGNTVRLTPEQREIAKNLGVSELDYARQVQAFDAVRKADPEKYR